MLLFLNPDSPAGFTSPVGLAEGCFRIAGSGTGAVARNDVGNVNLRGGAAQAAAARTAGSAPADGPGASTGPRRMTPGPIPLDELVGRIHALAAAPAR